MSHAQSLISEAARVVEDVLHERQARATVRLLPVSP